jgi:hypothetical protein
MVRLTEKYRGLQLILNTSTAERKFSWPNKVYRIRISAVNKEAPRQPMRSLI